MEEIPPDPYIDEKYCHKCMQPYQTVLGEQAKWSEFYFNFVNQNH